ncbi:MAG: high-potential iron-sulfur protein [Halolamina sp.]|uniref:high-potential iron-sulfur protein n=1 Tax=Halolamina sp. TaxID=1940283 RepID=UPI002FC2A048
MLDKESNSRRRFLQLCGTTMLTTSLAGCGGNGGNGGTPTADSDEVPPSERTATSQGGQERDPDSVVAPSDLNYQDEPNGDEQCSNCQFYITDQNDDGMGACTLLSGEVSPNGWCSSYARYEG